MYIYTYIVLATFTTYTNTIYAYTSYNTYITMQSHWFNYSLLIFNTMLLSIIEKLHVNIQATKMLHFF